MYRKAFAALAAAALVLLGAAPAASAASPGVSSPARPRTTGLHLTSATVKVHGPAENPVFYGCQAIHPPSSDCGYVDVHVGVSGFDAYGGLSDDDSVYDQLGHLGGSSATLTELYTCGSGTRPHLLRTRLVQAGLWGGYGDTTNAYTRVGTDAADLVTGFSFPNPSGTCAGFRVLRGWVSQVRVGFVGVGGAPDAVWPVHGVHRVPLPA